MAKKLKAEKLPTREEIAELAEDAMFAEGFDDCILGTVSRFGAPTLVLYDEERVIQKLMSRDGMDRDTAEEFFSVNIIGAWVGEGTPAFATVLRK